MNTMDGMAGEGLRFSGAVFSHTMYGQQMPTPPPSALEGTRMVMSSRHSVVAVVLGAILLFGCGSGDADKKALDAGKTDVQGEVRVGGKTDLDETEDVGGDDLRGDASKDAMLPDVPWDGTLSDAGSDVGAELTVAEPVPDAASSDLVVEVAGETWVAEPGPDVMLVDVVDVAEEVWVADPSPGVPLTDTVEETAVPEVAEEVEEEIVEEVIEPDIPENPGCDPAAPGTGLAVAAAPSFSVAVSASTPIFRTLTNNGKQHYPDSAVSFRNTGGSWEVYLAVGRETYRLTGSSPTNMNLNPGYPVLAPTDNTNDPHHGYAGVTSLTECDGLLTAFYHAEYHAIPVGAWPDCPAPYHASMGRATLQGGGGTLGVDAPPWFLTSSGTASYGQPKCAYGAGGGSIFDPGGEYLYLYYYDWDAPNGVYLARTCRDDCGEVGTWRKYNNGSFSGEAFAANFLNPSGPSSSILPAGPGMFDAFTVVSFNSYLNAYLMVAATESGYSLRVSADGVNWGPRVVLLRHLQAIDVTIPVLYPTVVDAGTWQRDSTGRNLKLVHATVSDDLGQLASHRAFVADVQLTKAGDAQTVSYDRRKLTRYYSPGTADHWCTTANVGGYASEGGLGKLAANSIPGTRPFYDCVMGGKDHMVSLASNCEGGASLGIMGYAWLDSAPNRHPVYRCWMTNADGSTDHFISVDPGCEGLNSEGIFGYLE